MKAIVNKIEKIFAGIAFTEDRKIESIRKHLRKILEELEGIFVTIALAEEGKDKNAKRSKGRGGYASRLKPNTGRRVSGFHVSRA